MPDDTWGEWEQPELGFEDEIPSAVDVLTARTNEQVELAGQADLLDYAQSPYQIPTSTTNPARPRTVAAKYDKDEQAVYVVMRAYRSQGTMKTPVVRYSPVSALDWANFKRAYSKGRYILLNWTNQIDHDEISDLGGFDAFLLTAANYAVSQQEAREGLQAGQSASSRDYQKLRKAVAEGRRVSDVKLRNDRLGGTARKRSAKATAEAARSFYKGPPTIG